MQTVLFQLFHPLLRGKVRELESQGSTLINGVGVLLVRQCQVYYCVKPHLGAQKNVGKE